MRRISLLLLFIPLILACESESEKLTNEEKAALCLAAVTSCNERLSTPGELRTCLNGVARQICVGLSL